MWIDGHCHLADVRFSGRIDEVIARASRAGVTQFVQGGFDPPEWDRQLGFQRPECHLTFGLHPWFVISAELPDLHAALSLLPSYLPSAVALGELGLDYGPRSKLSDRDRQLHFFRAQLELARDLEKPLVIHCVRAHKEVLAELRRVAATWRGIVHAFQSSLEVARQYRALGLYISLGNALLKPGHNKLKRAVEDLPLDWVTIESDAPDGGRPPHLNYPHHLIDVATAVADIQGVSSQDVLLASNHHLKTVFALDEVR